MTLSRQWYQCRQCEGERGYAAETLLKSPERLTRLLRSHVCRFSSDVSFAQTSEHLEATLGVSISEESCRLLSEREAKRMVEYETSSSVSDFQSAAGEVEFQTDAAKVNTIEHGWKDLKIACFLKREPGESATVQEWESRTLPAPGAKVAWAAIAKSKSFRKTWRVQAKRLGIAQGGEVHALGDGASWIWKGLEGSLSGCRQTLDIFHGAQKFAQAGEELYGPGSEEAQAVHERGRELLLERGWEGVTAWMGEELAKEDTPGRRRILEKVLKYFVPHVKRLDYAELLKEGKSIGSGAIEGLAKTLGLRLKLRGARWKRKHIRPMAALINLRHSPSWAYYWTSKAA